MLRLRAVDTHVPELGVGKERAVAKKRGTDPGAEGKEDNCPVPDSLIAECHLCDTCSVRVVEH